MVGPGARGIGYWTEKNGIVEELNFPSPKTSESKLGPIIWPGEASSPPKGWVIPTNGKKLRVGVPVKNGFTEFVRVTWNSDNSSKVEGYCVDIFEVVMASLPFCVPYEYILFETPDRDMAGTYDDLTYQVFLGNFDAVAGDVTIVANRSEYVDFTLPYTESAVAMVVPIQDDKSKNAWVFPKGCPLVPHVSRAILQVTEGPKMVEIEKKWLGNDNKCPDPDSLRTPQSLGIESFWALFAVVGFFGVAVLVIYVIKSFFFENDNNDHQVINWEGELANGIVELVRRLHNNIDQGINHANMNANE
ncbi:hypothetical protein DH2020_006087 [Rehmannia glutinosa]|uniref:Ionotropic glutamate receptor C-terminal domain-containing protein n=1 Tax=Rehmannia glutinosa TaxID=99300 RepID=A0ABR0XIF5_REHGL